MKWWKSSLERQMKDRQDKAEKQMKDLQDKIERLSIEDAGVSAEHNSIATILKSADTMPLYLIDKVRELSRRHAEIEQEVRCLQSKHKVLAAIKYVN